MQDRITGEKLEKYFKITEEALKAAEKSKNRTSFVEEREDMLDMVSRYVSDARSFCAKEDYVNAFACLNYAHGWLDAGARLGIFDVHDSRLFTVDDE